MDLLNFLNNVDKLNVYMCRCMCRCRPILQNKKKRPENCRVEHINIWLLTSQTTHTNNFYPLFIYLHLSHLI